MEVGDGKGFRYSCNSIATESHQLPFVAPRTSRPHTCFGHGPLAALCGHFCFNKHGVESISTIANRKLFPLFCTNVWNFAQYDGFGSLLSAPSVRAFGECIVIARQGVGVTPIISDHTISSM